MKILPILLLIFPINCTLTTFIKPLYEGHPDYGDEFISIKWAPNTVAILPVKPVVVGDWITDPITELRNETIQIIFHSDDRPTEQRLTDLGEKIMATKYTEDGGQDIPEFVLEFFYLPSLCAYREFELNGLPELILHNRKGVDFSELLIQYVENIAVMGDRIQEKALRYNRIPLNDIFKSSETIFLQFKKFTETEDFIITSAIQESFKKPFYKVTLKANACKFQFSIIKFKVLHQRNGLFRLVGSFYTPLDEGQINMRRFWNLVAKCLSLDNILCTLAEELRSKANS